jgi:hypothetical protein
MADVDDTLLVWFGDKVIKVFHAFSPAAVTNQADVENRTQSKEASIFQVKNVMDPLFLNARVWGRICPPVSITCDRSRLTVSYICEALSSYCV